MKGLRKMSRSVLMVFNIILMTLIIAPMWQVSDAATREENIHKIETFLADEVVAGSLMEKGVSPEKIIGQLDSMSDTQLEKLAENAELQVGGALDDDPTKDFWTFYKWYMIAALALTVLMIFMI